MKFLWLGLITFLSLASASSYNITGSWIGDWQNLCWAYCAPVSIDITPIDNSTSLNITYNILDNAICSIFNITTFSSILTPSNDTTWTDPFGGVLVYDPVNALISYPFVNGTTTALLYHANGANSAIDQDFAFGSIVGAWRNPTPIDPSANNSQCCMPDNILLYFTGPYSQKGQLTAVYNYNSSRSCPVSDHTYFNILSPNPQTLNWTVPVGDLDMPEILFTPSNSSTQLSFLLNGHNTCGYYYEKLIPALLNSSTWLGDWQTASNTNMPTTYQIEVKNQSIMATSITTNVGELVSSYLIQTIDGLYLDSYIGFFGGTTFTYDNQTNTLLNITNSTNPTANMLLSPNGSLFEPTPFIGFWTNPQALDNSSLPNDCCVPSWVNITNDTTIHTGVNLTVTYGYNNYNNYKPRNEGCNDIAQYEDSDGNVVTDLYIQVPNITQLFWLDKYGNQVSFVNTTSTSQITVTNFFGQCSFNLVLETPNPNPPGPLSASWISYQVVYLVLAIFIILN